MGSWRERVREERWCRGWCGGVAWVHWWTAFLSVGQREFVDVVLDVVLS